MRDFIRANWHWLILAVDILGALWLLRKIEFSNEDSGFRIRDYGDKGDK